MTGQNKHICPSIKKSMINPVKILQDLVVKRTLVLPYAVPMEAVVSSLIHERFATAASSLQVRKGHWNWQALEATVKAELRTSN